MADPRLVGIIAGSGFESFADGSAGEVVKTRFGVPSSPVRQIRFGSLESFLLSRHGDAMIVPPHEINYRANMAAFQQLGVTHVVALNTVGIIVGDAHPGQIAVPGQIIDYTYGRDHSIYGGSSDTLDHIEFTEPFDSELRRELLAAAMRADVPCRDGGVYAVTQGPRLETAAEVDRLERDGADYIGMTAMPEAALAMELGMRYACLSLLVNYAAGRGDQSIHADLEESTLTAKMQSIKILRSFFSASG